VGGGEALVAQPHQQRDEGHRAHAAGDVLAGDHGQQQQVERRRRIERDEAPVEGRHHHRAPRALAELGEQVEAEVRHQLQHAEQQQRAVQRQPRHDQPADEGAEDGEPDADDLVGDADLFLREAHALDQEGRGQAAGEGVAELVQDDQRQEGRRPAARSSSTASG
jgi:hypothetical protein